MDNIRNGKRGKESAIERINRILDLIPMIRGGRYLIEDLANQYGVEPFQIQRDLEIAFICGLPGYTPDILIDLSIEDGFIEVFDPLVLDKPRAISFQDLIAVSMGLEILKSTAKNLNIHPALIDGLHKKLQSSLTPTSIVNIEDERINDALTLITRSIVEKRVLHFNYFDSNGRKTVDRQIFALNHFWQNSIPMFEGIDIEKEGRRIFHLSRMDQVVLGNVYELPFDIPISRSDPTLIKVKISLSEKWWLLRFSEFLDEQVEIDSKGVNFLLKFWEREWLIRTLAPVSREISFPDLTQEESNAIRVEIDDYLSAIPL
jgi:predicted DNA-binding transcriptional regulator YafY